MMTQTSLIGIMVTEELSLSFLEPDRLCCVWAGPGELWCLRETLFNLAIFYRRREDILHNPAPRTTPAPRPNHKKLTRDSTDLLRSSGECTGKTAYSWREATRTFARAQQAQPSREQRQEDSSYRLLVVQGHCRL
jgi:hypothetical protein